MNKKQISNEIIFFIDKGLSREKNKYFNLMKDFRDNHPSLPQQEIIDVLEEMLKNGEIVQGDYDCGTDTLIVTAFMPNTAAYMMRVKNDKSI